MENFLEKIKAKAKKCKQTIILPEGDEIRILQSANNIVKDKVANIVLVGNKVEIEEKIKQNNLDALNSNDCVILDINQNSYSTYLSQKLFELRKEKGVTLEKAQELINDTTYFSMMMLKENMLSITGLVSGSIHSTADTLRPALQIIKTAKSSKLVSAFFVMDTKNPKLGSDGIFVFADCGLNPNPNAQELAYIAIDSANSFEQIVGETPKVAMLSYSSKGSANSELTQKMVEATNIAKQLNPTLILDGELQVDSAIVPEIAVQKAKGSAIQGDANVLVFPNLDSGNIAYKLVQRVANADAFGPLCQGLQKPVNDLSRGSTVTDIEGVIAITCLQAQKI